MEHNSLVIDAADPKSLATILPDSLAPLVEALPRELLIQDEVTLTTLVNPSDQQRRIKIQFWDEYEEAIKQSRKIILSNVIYGVSTLEYFLEFCSLARNVAWLVSPRPSYKLRVSELIERGLDAIEDIFRIVPNDKNRISVHSLQLSALKMLDLRKHGGYVQRAEVKTLNRNIEMIQAQQQSSQVGEGSIEELEQQVKDLENRISEGKNQNGSLLNASVRDVVDVDQG